MEPDLTNNFDLRRINSLVLAYIGDGVYELAVRKHLLEKSPYVRVNTIHTAAVRFVKATSQCFIIKSLISDHILSEEELDTVIRARNASQNPPKNVPPAVYNMATGFEALIGSLYISGSLARLNQITDLAINIIETKNQHFKEFRW